MQFRKNKRKQIRNFRESDFAFQQKTCKWPFVLRLCADVLIIGNLAVSERNRWINSFIYCWTCKVGEICEFPLFVQLCWHKSLGFPLSELLFKLHNWWFRCVPFPRLITSLLGTANSYTVTLNIGNSCVIVLFLRLNVGLDVWVAEPTKAN